MDDPTIITGDDARITALAQLGDDMLEVLGHALATYGLFIDAFPAEAHIEDPEWLPVLSRLVGAAQLHEAPAVVPHDCTSCGNSMANCDRSMVNHGRPCCGSCHLGNTHGDTDWEASCARMAKVRADLEPF